MFCDFNKPSLTGRTLYTIQDQDNIPDTVVDGLVTSLDKDTLAILDWPIITV